MSISTYSGTERHGGIAGRIWNWLAERENRPGGGRDFTRLETFNDHLLRDIGLHPHPTRNHRRYLMRF